MPFNGSGSYSLYTPGNPVVAGTTIEDDWWNNTGSDLATALSTCVTKDGQTTTTAVVPFALGLSLAGGSTLANYVASGNFTPTVTLVGGAGNTTPVYSTNTGRYMRIGSTVFVDVYLNGDGGAEGAGTGVINIALPIAASASAPAGGYFPCGRAVDNTNILLLIGDVSASATTISLAYMDDSTFTSPTFTGADQANATRSIRLKFFYEC